MNLEQLDDFPALQQLAQALWHEGTARGAAVLIGAGFSRNAARPGSDTPMPPLWSSLVRIMAAKLYSNPKDAPCDALRLAEEYRTNFGQTALDEFVRTHIRDSAWEPGVLHHELLELPWSEVLTTNWDTLLERAKPTRRWEVVRTTADLAHGREHRIIKLHGTVGVSEHFVFAEEDYRAYPSRFAAFVNTARQVFIENELCLLGFSGDDPNFLQWSGWVREHLAESARRIYLIGVLDLKVTKRKFLESRNIAPIDLGPLAPSGTRDEREASATAQLLRYLANAKPKAPFEWEPAASAAYDFMPKALDDIQRAYKDPDYAASLIDQAARVWRKDRESYPSWLVCPPKLRRALYYAMDVARWQQPVALGKLEPKRRAEVLYEIVWRISTAYQLFDPRFDDLLASCTNPQQPYGLEKRQQMDIVLALLRLARQRQDDHAFHRWAALLIAHTEPGSDLHAEAVYQQCLRARDRLDLRGLAHQLRGLDGPDPIWRLRRAALHCELGEFATATALVIEARGELRERQRQDGRSLSVRSRLAWVEWLFGATRESFSLPPPSPWALDFKQSLCDPQTELEALTDEAAHDLRQRREDDLEAIPLFEAGHYKDPSKATRLRDGTIAAPLDSLERLIETVGLPIYFKNFDMLGAVKDDAASLGYEPSFAWYVWLLRTRHNQLDRQFNRYFGRVAIAGLPADVALELSDRMSDAIAFWRQRIKDLGLAGSGDRLWAIERLRLSVEALSRLTPRQDAERARATFEIAMDMAREPLQHLWLIEPMSNLAHYSAQAVAPAVRSDLVLGALECPLSTEKGGIEGPWRWLNPIGSIFGVSPTRPDGDTRWAHRIEQLIQAVQAGGTGRQEATLRLYYLTTHGALTETERVSFGAAIWSARDTTPSALPIGTNLPAHTFLELPAPHGIDRDALVRSYLFETNVGELLKPPQPFDSRVVAYKQNRLLELVAAASNSIYPTQPQAARLFSELIASTTDGGEVLEKGNSSFEPFQRQFYTSAKSYAGSILARLVVPSLASEARTEDAGKALLSFIGEPPVGNAIAALPYFVHLSAMRSEVNRRVRRGIAGRVFDEVSGSAMAIEAWAGVSSHGDAGLPDPILEQLVTAIETRHTVGLHALIQCVCKLIEMRRLRPGDGPRLDEALGDLISASKYEEIDLDSKEAVSVSLVRVACVWLASALQKAGIGGPNASAWLEAARADPLPEVRFEVA